MPVPRIRHTLSKHRHNGEAFENSMPTVLAGTFEVWWTVAGQPSVRDPRTSAPVQGNLCAMNSRSARAGGSRAKRTSGGGMLPATGNAGEEVSVTSGGSGSRPRGRPTDPAAIAAESMLRRALGKQGFPAERLRTPGLVAVVLVETSEWVEPARQGWAALAGGERPARMLEGQPGVGDGEEGPQTFEIRVSPRDAERRSNDERFAMALCRGQGAIGFTPHDFWLPRDLTMGADLSLELGPLSPELVGETACRLAGGMPTFAVSPDEAALVSPRLLRLAVRPGQTGDGYLAKLRTLIGRQIADSIDLDDNPAGAVFPGAAAACQQRDPAALAATGLLGRSMADNAMPTGKPNRPGAVTVVAVPSAEWVRSVRDAWIETVCGGEPVSTFGRDRNDPRGPSGTLVMDCDKAPNAFDREQSAEAVSEAAWRGRRMVGIAPELEWLPPDLVAMADDVLRLDVPRPGALRDLVLQLTGVEPSFELSDAEAAAIGPRMLRLACRPCQTADEYLARLRQLVRAAGKDAGPKPGGSPPTFRTCMRLERLPGMDEAVAWGLAVREDLAAFRAGRLAWADVDKGLLLSGPPGCGKTLYAQALAESCGVPLIEGSWSKWLANGTGHQGDFLLALKRTFAAARDAAPCVVFIDEVDSFPDRGALTHAYKDWEIQVVNALLAELDGVQGREGVVVVAACNNPHLLDPALVRSGRLDRHVRIGLPDRSALSRIMREHLGSELADEDLDGAALLAAGATGADAERFVRGARRRARNAGRDMRLADLLSEIGEGDDRTPEEVGRCAVHEAGHAVVCAELGRPVTAVSIRGNDVQGGMMVRARRGFFATAHDIHDELVCLLAGRAAEEALLGQPASGAGGDERSDLAAATWRAARAACELGLDGERGLLWEPMPERRTDLRSALSGDPALAGQVTRRLSAAYRDALAIVARRLSAVGAVAAALTAQGALSGDEISRIAAAAG